MHLGKTKRMPVSYKYERCEDLLPVTSPICCISPPALGAGTTLGPVSPPWLPFVDLPSSVPQV